MGGAIFFYITLILFVLALTWVIYSSIRFVRDKHVINIDYKTNLLKIGLGVVAFSVFFTLFMVSIAFFGNLPLKAIEWAGAILGGFFFSLGIGLFISTFIIHYYKKALDTHLNKLLYIIMMITIPVMIIFFVICLESYSEYAYFPLSLGIRFDEKGVWFPTYIDKEYGGKGATIAWYALCILGGAMVVYFICDHKFYQQYGKHGLLESTLFVALPAGIIGARIWFVVIDVIGNPSSIYRTDPVAIFRIWDGGLAIMGGAVFGILIGSLWFKWRRKGYSLLHAADIIVPAILVAQAIGRWGNFFNYEVYGQAVPMANWWFIPSFIRYQMDVGFSMGGTPTGTTMYVPLFFIEFITNLAGYFLITYGAGKLLKKYIKLGDLACGYLIWYGLTRVIMEPMRASSFEYDVSWYTAFGLIGAGVLLIVFNHVFRYVWAKKHREAI